MSILQRWLGDPIEAVEEIEAQRTTRARRAAITTFAAVAARALSLAGAFVAVPLTIQYLGTERYGLFVTLTSATALLVFADLGLGNGVLNLVSDALGRGDRVRARQLISSAVVMLAAVGSVLAVVFVIAFSFVPWATLFSLSDIRAREEVGPTAAVLIVLFLVALPLGVTERVRMALQEGYANSAAVAVGAVASLIALAIAIGLRFSLPFLVLATSLPGLLALAGNAYLLLHRQRPWLAPRISLATRAFGVRLARLGFLFLTLQLAVAVAFQSDVVVAGSVLGPAQAATYAVTLKAMMLAPTLVAMYLAALWPAYTEAIARGDIQWVRATLRRSIVIAGLFSGAASVTLVLTGQWLIAAWTGGAVEPPLLLLVGTGCWAVVFSTFNAIAILLNAASVIRFQVVVAAIMALGSIGLSIVLAYAVGLPGIIWGTLVAYVVLAAIPTAIYTPRLLRRLDQQAQSGTVDE